MDFRAFKNSRRGLWVGRGLVAVGFVTMCVLVYFQARHGWSMGTWIGDQIGFAALHGIVDIATFFLVSAGGILFAWGMRKMGFAACLFAGVLTLVSILWVSGFMSGRIAALEGQKAALNVLEKHAKWTGGTTYREAGKSERRSLRMEMRENVKEMVKVASIIPDTHALALANITGWTIEFCQRLLILISSGVAQAIKYITLLVGFFLLSNRDERHSDAASDTGNSGSGGGGKGKPDQPKQPDTKRVMQADHSNVTPLPKRTADAGNSPAIPVIQPTQRIASNPVGSTRPKMSDAELLDYLQRISASGLPVSQRAIAQRCGWSQPTIHRRLKHLRERKPVFRTARPFVHHGGQVSLSG